MIIEIIEDDPIHPTLIGKCGNQLSRYEYCLKQIYDNENYEKIGKILLCECCVDKLLTPKTSRDDPEDRRFIKHSNPFKVSKRSAPGSFGVINTVSAR